MKLPNTGFQFHLTKGIYAIAGISKNCGKTSLLNYLLAHQNKTPVGVLTTGRDGEEKDMVFGNPKPAVILPKGTLFTATAEVAAKLGSAIEVLEKLPFNAANKIILLLKALREIATEIVGPADVSAQIQVAELMQAEGAEIVLIDGSLDRKSIALHPKVKSVFLVTGSSFGTLDKITAELTRLDWLAQIPVFQDKDLKSLQDNISVYRKGSWQRTDQSSLLDNEQEIVTLITDAEISKIYLPGAVTDTVFNVLKPALRNISEIIVRHPLHLHLNKTNLALLINSHRLSCLAPLKILGIAVNSWSVTGNHLDSKILRNTVREMFPSMPVIDIYEA